MTEIIERTADLIPELAERREEYLAAKKRVRDLVSGIDEPQFKRRSDDDSWSMAECVEHLVMTGQQMIPRMEKAIDDARNREMYADGPFSYGFMGNKFMDLIGDGQLPPKKLRAPSVFKPRTPETYDLQQTVDRFERLQDEYVRLVDKANGIDLRKVTVTSAVTRLIRLSLGQWLEGLAAHQRRHLWQAEQVKSQILAAEMT